MRTIRKYIQRMIEIANDILAYSQSHNYEDFMKEKSIVRHGICKCIEELGETSNSIAKHHPNYEGLKSKVMIGTRNILAHSHHKVNYVIIREIAKHEVPHLLEFLQSELSKLPDEN